MLNSFNFNSWQKNLLIVLAVMDLNFMLRVDSPLPFMDDGSPNDKEKIER